MHKNELGDGLGGGCLRMDQNLDARLGLVELRRYREAPLVHTATPVVACDGSQVRISKVGNKGPHHSPFYDPRKNEGTDKGTVPLESWTQEAIEPPLKSRTRPPHSRVTSEATPLARRDRQAG